jgi:hypothetical protein
LEELESFGVGEERKKKWERKRQNWDKYGREKESKRERENCTKRNRK